MYRAGHQTSSFQTYSDVKPISRKPSIKSTTLEGQTLDLSLPGYVYKARNTFFGNSIFKLGQIAPYFGDHKLYAPGWFLDGFGFKPLQDILFRFLNIVFNWSFDSEFGLLYEGYLHPDFIFIFCLFGLFVFKDTTSPSSFSNGDD